MAPKDCFLGAVRRRTMICCRNVKISASIAARDRNRSTTAQTMSLTRSLITDQHRPILGQPPASLRKGQANIRNAPGFVPKSSTSWRRDKDGRHAFTMVSTSDTATPCQALVFGAVDNWGHRNLRLHCTLKLI